MRGVRFWNRITAITLGKLCQQRLLLAGLTLLCLFLPLFMAPAAESALSRGVDFSGITLALTGAEGDTLPAQLEKLLPNMTDVSRYCRVTALSYDEALESLAAGEVTAVLVLPENLAGGIMNGTNPDVTLVVSGDRPLESLLTLWLGQSASDLLAAVQSGIYAVLELYGENPPEGLSYQEVMTTINLRYISWTMNRQELFRVRTVSATEQLSAGLHYGLSLLLFLSLALAPFFQSVFTRQWLEPLTRFRAAGRGFAPFYLAALAACWAVLFPLITAASLLLARGSIPESLLAGAVCALFCAAFGAVCCLLTEDTGSCGMVSFVLALVFLALSGGILPPVLMPRTLRELMVFSPVTWLRELLAWPAGFGAPAGLAAAVLLTMALAALGAALYRRRALGKEARPWAIF